MLDTKNTLESNYNKNFLTHQLGQLVKEVPEERRKELADEIRMKAALFGCKNESALKTALKKLEGGS